jgi:hypothetical protein
MYGSNDSTCVLPEFNNVYLRGVDFNSLNDPESSSRYSPSGILPSGHQVGSFQLGSMQRHEHISGSMQLFPHGGGITKPHAVLSVKTTTDLELIGDCSRFTVVSGVDETLWEPANYKVYPYIQIS